MNSETTFDINEIKHIFLKVEAADSVCMLNLAGHPNRISEVIYRMVLNGCRVAQANADQYNRFDFDKEVTEIYDYLSSIIKAKFR